MKKLVLCRHAKSSWKYDVDDIYRPLNKRGLDNAPAMARHYRGNPPDIILCSPAVRTYATALAYINENSWPLSLISLQQELYEASSENLLQALTYLDTHEKNNYVWLIGHNPGLELLAEYLSCDDIEPMVTSSVVEFKLDITHWRDIEHKSAHIRYSSSPKEVLT